MVLLSEPYVCSMPSAEQGVAPEAVAEAYHAYEQGSKVAPLSAAAVSNQTIQESQRLLLLVRAYQANFSQSAFVQSAKCCSQGSSSLSMTCQRLPGARILSSGNVPAACRHLTAWIYSKDKGKLGTDNWIAIRLCKMLTSCKWVSDLNTQHRCFSDDHHLQAGEWAFHGKSGSPGIGQEANAH
jgi:hypothetical protein